jgi:transcription elongation factor GreA
MVGAMAEERFPIFDARLGSQNQPVGRTDHLLTAADYAALVRELEALRARHHRDVAERLRIARGFSCSPDDDDLLAVLEEAAIEQARIAQLEAVVRTASVVEGPAATDGAAGLGTIVRVIDDAGRTTGYELVGRRTSDSHRHAVSLSSPVGKALLGARSGDVVEAVLPSGRRRTLRVLDVEPCQPIVTSSSAARIAEAA